MNKLTSIENKYEFWLKFTNPLKKNINIKLDRKTLYLRLKDGKKYKDYSFFYK